MATVNSTNGARAAPSTKQRRRARKWKPAEFVAGAPWPAYFCRFMEQVRTPVLTEQESREAWADAKWDSLSLDGKVAIAQFLQDRGV